MRIWWTSLAPRERILVIIAGALALAVVVWQFTLVPTLSGKAEARLELRQASQTLTRIQQAYMQRRAAGVLTASETGPSGQSAEVFKGAVTQSASEKGLSISRLQAGNEGTLSLVFDQVDPRLLFLWLEDVESRLSGRVTRLSMDQAGEGMVRLSVDIEKAVE